MSEALLVVCSFPGADEARRITDAVVAQRLAACVHVFPQGSSAYWWKGNIEHADECYALLKTTAAAFPALEAAIKAQHSYELPSIVVLPLAGGHAPYLSWIGQEVTGA